MADCEPKLANVDLIGKQIRAQGPIIPFKNAIVDLLTDSRITLDSYLWHGSGPADPPPEEWFQMSDINDGFCYRETWNKLIKPHPLTSFLLLCFSRVTPWTCIVENARLTGRCEEQLQVLQLPHLRV